MPFADLGGVRLFYTDDGRGRPLLLVHGWGGDSHTWSFHLVPLAARYRVIAVDLRGHGRSSVPETGYGPRDMAGDLAELLRLLAAGPVVAIGHSMGVQVVTVLAVEHPDLVDSVVAVDPAYGADDAEAAAAPARLAALWRDGAAEAARSIGGAFTEGSPGWLRTWHTRQLLGMAGHVLAAAYAGMYLDVDAFGFRAAAEAYLARRKCPALSLWSYPDLAAWERGLGLPGADVVRWTGVGHYLHEERPAEFVALLEQWLEDHGLADDQRRARPTAGRAVRGPAPST
jgi:pimeloyl-ACP methyl ester carboxylesterase